MSVAADLETLIHAVNGIRTRFHASFQLVC